MRIRTFGYVMFLTGHALACASVGGFGVSAEPSNDAKFREVVVKYVAEARSWPASDYVIQRSRAEGNSVVFTAVSYTHLTLPTIYSV